MRSPARVLLGVTLCSLWRVATGAESASAAVPEIPEFPPPYRPEVEPPLFRCPTPQLKPQAPELATDYNGANWPSMCFEPRELEEHVFIIGDWGGIFAPGALPYPANDTKPGRGWVKGVDDQAQLLVAAQMNQRAAFSKPRYVLNVGDNFYWGGVLSDCGAGASRVLSSTLEQWDRVYERIYNGPELLGKPWLGVLGNHDFGGYMFTKGWDQAIAYTWGDSGRWLTPALYWRTKAIYADFTVDYYMVDSNVNDAFPPMDQPSHNMCSESNNLADPSCGASGPVGTWGCFNWFQALWNEQVSWMDRNMKDSTADWLIVVTHFPPEFRRDTWARLASSYGIDLIVTGHRHQQEMSRGRDPYIGNAAWVVSGGGGGITSEGRPNEYGQDDQYGFMDMTLSKQSLKIESISHSGVLRKEMTIDAWRKSTTTSTRTTTRTSTTTATTRPTTTTTLPTTSTSASSSAPDASSGDSTSAAGSHGDSSGGGGSSNTGDDTDSELHTSGTIRLAAGLPLPLAALVALWTSAL